MLMKMMKPLTLLNQLETYRSTQEEMLWKMMTRHAWTLEGTKLRIAVLNSPLMAAMNSKTSKNAAQLPAPSGSSTNLGSISKKTPWSAFPSEVCPSGIRV